MSATPNFLNSVKSLIYIIFIYEFYEIKTLYPLTNIIEKRNIIFTYENSR